MISIRVQNKTGEM